MKKAVWLIFFALFVLTSCNLGKDENQYDDGSVGFIAGDFDSANETGAFASAEDILEPISGAESQLAGQDIPEEGELLASSYEVVATTTTTVKKEIPTEEELISDVDLPAVTESMISDSQTTYYETLSVTTTTVSSGYVYSASEVTVMADTVNVVTSSSGTSSQSGAYFKVGSDVSGQSVNPRESIVITTVIFNDEADGAWADVGIFAVPKGQTATLSWNNIIGWADQLQFVNGQAQFTRYWNADNSAGEFFDAGKYNIYLYYKIDDADGAVLSTGSRYWGWGQDYYITVE